MEIGLNGINGSNMNSGFVDTITIPKKEYFDLKKKARAFEELVGGKLKKEEQEMKQKGEKYLSEQKALSKYKVKN